MRRIVVFTFFASTLLVSAVSAVRAQESRPGDPWQVPACSRIAGTSSVAITADEGATLVTSGRPLRPTTYAYGLAVLEDAPNTILLAQDRTLLRSTTAGCRWVTLGEIPTTSDGFPSSLVAGRGDRAYAWSENRNDLARIDGKTITVLGNPAESVVGLATHPTDPDVVRFGGGDGFLYESTNAGDRFGPIGTQVPGGSFLYYRAAFDPANLDHVVYGAVVNGVYVTFDGGRTWTQATGLSSTGTGQVNAFNVVVSPADPNTVFAMALDIAELDAGGPGRHIYLSRDGGLSFRKVVDPSAEVILINGNTMAAHPTDADVLYFSYGSSFGGYGADLYRYDDATGAVTKTHNPYHGLHAIGFHPVDPGVMYLGLSLEAFN
jgi:hypothetical protein